MKYFRKNIIDSIKLLFDGNIRIESKDTDYFNLIQPFEHHKRKIKNGIHLYSFSLHQKNINLQDLVIFSKINNVKARMDLGLKTNIKEIPVNTGLIQITLIIILMYIQ